MPVVVCHHHVSKLELCLLNKIKIQLSSPMLSVLFLLSLSCCIGKGHSTAMSDYDMIRHALEYEQSSSRSLPLPHPFAQGAIKYFQQHQRRNVDVQNTEDMKQTKVYMDAQRIQKHVNVVDRNSQWRQLDLDNNLKVLELTRTALEMDQSYEFRNYLSKMRDKFIDVIPLPFEEFQTQPLLGVEYFKMIYEVQRDDDLGNELFKIIPRDQITVEGEQYLKSKMNFKSESFSGSDDSSSPDSSSDLFSNSQSSSLSAERVLRDSAAWKSVGDELVKVGQMNGDEDLVLIGSAIGSATTFATGAAMFSTASGFVAAAGPAGMMVAASIAIFSLIGSSSSGGNDAFEALHQSLVAIQNSLLTLRREMHEEFHQVHEELFELYGVMVHNHRAVTHSLSSIQDSVDFGFAEMTELLKTDLFVEVTRITHNAASNELPRSAEGLRKELNILENFALGVSMTPSFNGANLRGEDYKHSATKQQLNFRKSPVSNIAFYMDYASTVLKVTGLSTKESISLPNLDVFNKVADTFVTVTLQALAHDASLDSLARTSGTDVLLDASNRVYVTNALTRLVQMNKRVDHALSAMQNDNVLVKIVQQYTDQWDAFSDYVMRYDKEKSLELNFAATNEPHSLFSPSYDTIYNCLTVQTGDLRGKHSFTYSEDADFGNIRLHKKIEITATGRDGMRQHSRAGSRIIKKVQSNQCEDKQEIKDSVLTKLKEMRSKLTTTLIDEDSGFQEHRDILLVLEHMANGFSQLLRREHTHLCASSMSKYFSYVSDTAAEDVVCYPKHLESSVETLQQSMSTAKLEAVSTAYVQYPPRLRSKMDVALKLLKVFGSESEVLLNSKKVPEQETCAGPPPPPRREGEGSSSTDKLDKKAADSNNKQPTHDSNSDSRRRRIELLLLQDLEYIGEAIVGLAEELDADILNDVRNRNSEQKKQKHLTFMTNLKASMAGLAQSSQSQPQFSKPLFCDVFCADQFYKLHVDFYRAGMRDDPTIGRAAASADVLASSRDDEPVRCRCF